MPIELTPVQKIAVWALPILFALTLREIAHGWAAYALGDRTPMMFGRLSLNPLNHADPIGTVVIPLVMILLGGFVFGWARPVPVSMRNFKHPRRGMALVAAAGPLANFVMAFLWALLLRLALAQEASEGMWLGVQAMSLAGVSFNLVIAIINLLPIPPLDGGRMVNGLLPSRLSMKYERLEPYGFFIVAIFLMTPMFNQLLYWPMALAQYFIFSLAGVSAHTL
ncbi:MAG TPA: site-2 protease family protein [Nevskiaceae bacterium]|nr:site-2 protease family protein [Nevskiaceae bacterium]